MKDISIVRREAIVLLRYNYTFTNLFCNSMKITNHTQIDKSKTKGFVKTNSRCAWECPKKKKKQVYFLLTHYVSKRLLKEMTKR